MTQVNVNDYQDEKSCIYKGEIYSARDNGAVLRHPPEGKKARRSDNKWTFGRLDSKTGYLYFGKDRIHRIVAYAFHGEPPTSEHIADHIDTNRQNNRAENLRWVTRLENALYNPITLKRIILVCGSIDAFIADPSLLRNSSFDQNFEWMRAVTPEEAKIAFERLSEWAKSDPIPSGRGSLGEWVYQSRDPEAKKYISHSMSHANKMDSLEIISEVQDVVMSKTQGAAQRDWRTPAEFPSCPDTTEEKPLSVYLKRLLKDAIFSRTDYGEFKVLDSALSQNELELYVICESTQSNSMKPYAFAKITFEKGLYVHTSMGTFFTQEGAEKELCLALGLEWTGGEVFDDYC